jgi:NodT family efflux transporter outer membrane factor (OMF) lipoprotein
MRFALTSVMGIATEVLAGAVLASCAAGPDFARPAAPAVQRYTREPLPMELGTAQGLTQRLVPEARLAADWWRLFKSPALDAAVARALANNPTVQAAEANLRVAQDNLRAGNGVFYPRLDAGLAAERARSGPTQQGPAAPGSIFNLVTLSGSIGFPLDLFGAERRTVEGLGALVDVQGEARQAAYLTLTANVVNACIARAGYQAQIRSTEALIALETEQLGGIEAQVRAGTAPYANLLSQRSLIAVNRALLAPLRQRAAQAEHLIAQLQGDLPAQSTPPSIALDSLALPTDIPLGVPSELVRRRPDVLAAEAQLHAASANVGVATAAEYPSFTLDASYGAAGSSLSRLFGAGGRFWSIGPSLSAPLFHGGTLRAQRQAAVDAFGAARANYRQTVLAAFAQVADVLQALEHDAQALQAEAESEQDARESLALLQASYRAGVAAYVDVLTADAQYHSASIGTLQAATQRHQDTVALFVALGGGWWNPARMPGVAPRDDMRALP